MTAFYDALVSTIPPHYHIAAPPCGGELGALHNGRIINPDVILYQRRVNALYAGGALQPIENAIASHGSANILEIGPGHGVFARALAECFAGAVNVFLVDLPHYLQNPGEIFTFATFQAGGVFYGGLIGAPVYMIVHHFASQWNPYHWMLHEATHQLNREVAHLAIPKWIDEGLAAYFGASEIRDDKLIRGSIDINAYPIWWLPSLALSGNIEADFESRKIIPIRALISGTGGPDIAQNVNAYYIGYWSLTHFLFHFDHGRYASKFKQVIAEGGTLESFERNIGPVERIQIEWYSYLRQRADAEKHRS